MWCTVYQLYSDGERLQPADAQAHGNKYPQKLVMPHNQEGMLSCYFTQYDKPGTYWGVPIEIDPSSLGVMIGIDGAVMPFADYDLQAKDA